VKSAEMPPSSSAPENATKVVFVRRLKRLIKLRKDFQDDLNATGVELLDRSIYATYVDCVDFGAGIQARLLMAQAGIKTK
jgi:hypothetical protein